MRRNFLLGIAILVVAAAFAAWFASRPSPEAAVGSVVALVPPPPGSFPPAVDDSAAAGAPAAPLPVAGAALPPADNALPGTWVDVAARVAQGGAIPASAPLIVGLHGRGDTAEHFSAVAGRLGDAFAWRILQAPLPFAEGRQWFRDEADRAGLDAAIDLVHAHVRAQGSRKVALFGFSQGCMLALHYAIRYPQGLRVVVCAGGGLVHPVTESGTGIRPTILFLHGSDDLVVPLASARSAMQIVENMGFYTEIIEHGEGHTIPESETDRLKAWLTRKLR